MQHRQEISIRLTVAILVSLLTNACTSDSDEKFEVLIWANGPLSEDDFFPKGDVFDAPCGPIRLLEASSLRDLSEREFDSLERVLEFTEDGRVVGEWRMPVESYIIGIDRDWLTVSASGGQLSISPQGELRQADQADWQEEHEYFGDCPEPVLRDFLGPTGKSDYLACWKLRDGSTGRTRFLAYQGVCT